LNKPTVVIAGAAGFVGMPLVERLSEHFDVIALSRSARSSRAGVEWRTCDLLSGRDASAAVAGAELAIYLVHSMLPSDRLVQGSFEDFDLQAADNFSRACAAHGLRQIVYLGGLLPANVPRDRLSRHLSSRAEVETALAAKGVPVTVLRAGLVLGRGGSSTEIMLRMARRLPVMICPRWTNTPTQPIALEDILGLLEWVLGKEETFGHTYDVGGPEVITYRELMRMAGDRLGRKPRTLSVPLITPRLSRLWISLVTGAPKALAAPLVESLSHEMVAGDRVLQERAGIPGRPLALTIAAAVESTRAERPRAFHAGARRGTPVVRSVQRFAGTRLAPREAASEYFRWLGARFAPLLWVSDGDDPERLVRFASVRGPVLLRFRLDSSVSTADRVVYDIVGGLLVRKGVCGRFEFRSVLEAGTILCSVHGFSPQLWWPLYVVTQAQLHLVVMKTFARHLRQNFPLASVIERDPLLEGPRTPV
jgi:uncharacterized protein YbjT (DUF2867 family)